MILITGATGAFGQATIDFLLNKGISADSIIAFVRDAAKAEGLKARGVAIRVGNYDDYASMTAAFAGVDKLLLISGTDIANRQQQQEAAIRAAREAGVKHVIYTSFGRKNETDTNPLGPLAASHIATDNALKASGLTYTILQNSLYAEVLPMFLGEKVTETGIFFPAGDGKTAFATRTDMAEAAAAVLTGQGHENKTYAVGSDVNYSFHDLSAILGEVAGKPVPYTSPDRDIFIQALTGMGVPGEHAGFAAIFADAIRAGEFEAAHSDLEFLIGRKATPLAAYLTQIYGA